jgi:alkylated DNA repair protein (DNA oxidative demethylase)
MNDLFDSLPATDDAPVRMEEGAFLLPGFARLLGHELLHAIEAVTVQSPMRHMVTPGGYEMSVAMTNCGPLGWVTDRKGYRYSANDPLTGAPWPAMPEVFMDLAVRAAAAAGYPGFLPDACLINRYVPGAKMSLHQDKDERDAGKPQRYRLTHGDVAVWGGASRFYFHGVAPLADGDHDLVGRQRYNLTFRKVT